MEQAPAATSVQSSFSFSVRGVSVSIEGSEALIRDAFELLRSDVLPLLTHISEDDERPIDNEGGEPGREASKPPAGTPTSEGQLSPREYYDQKKPRVEHEKAAVFALYLKAYRGKTEFTVADIEGLFNEAHAPLKNVQNAIWNAGKKERGWIKVVAGRRQIYYLTAAGESFVKTQLPAKK